MENDEPPKLSFAERMKQKALQQKGYGQEHQSMHQGARIEVRGCPNCGAGRSQGDGLTCCAYCGFEFITAPLTDGLYIAPDKNSKS